MEPLAFNPQEEQYVQDADWTCAACSLAWLNRALGIDHATEEFTAVDYIGHPDHINELYGLMDASGARLRDCLREQGAPAFCYWPTFQQVVHVAQIWPMLLGGTHWYHWVGVRTSDGHVLYLANSAPGWHGVDQVLTEQQWNEEGPFACVAVPLLIHFPPPPPASA